MNTRLPGGVLARRPHRGGPFPALACTDGQGPTGEQTPPPASSPFVVSNPVTAPAPASPGVASSAQGDEAVAYVPLPPGTIPGRHRRESFLIAHRQQRQRPGRERRWF